MTLHRQGFGGQAARGVIWRRVNVTGGFRRRLERRAAGVVFDYAGARGYHRRRAADG